MNYCFYSILFKLRTYITYMFYDVFDKKLFFLTNLDCLLKDSISQDFNSQTMQLCQTLD